MIYITSDLHFGHNKPFVYEARGFSSIEEHDEAIIQRWNDIITNDDDVYILGDLMLNNNDNGAKCLKRLNGNKFMVRGNHDTDKRMEIYTGKDGLGIISMGDAGRLRYGGLTFYLSHFPTITGNNEPLKKTMINLYGHTHQNTNFYEDRPYMYHVGMDSHDCHPVDIDTIIKEIWEKERKVNR